MKNQILFLAIFLFFQGTALLQTPELVKDIAASDIPVLKSSNPQDFVEAAGKIFFFANDGTENGMELWRSDGTEAGTEIVQDVNFLTFAFEGGKPFSRLVVLRDEVYWLSREDFGSFGVNTRLWKAGAEGGATLVREFQESIQLELFSNRKRLFFIKKISEIWVSNGTTVGTRKLIDFGDRELLGLTCAGQQLYWYFEYPNQQTPDPRDGYRDLWATNGTLEGTKIIDEISDCMVTDLELFELQGRLAYLIAGGSICGYNTILFVDGFGRIEENHPPLSSTGIYNSVISGNRLYYYLWNPGGNILKYLESDTIRSISIGRSASGVPIRTNGLLYLQTPQNWSLNELYLNYTDGRHGTDKRLKTFEPGITRFQKTATGILFFRSETGSTEIWHTDGTVSGTILVAKFPEATADNPDGFVFDDIFLSKNRLFIIGGNSELGTELWKIDLPDFSKFDPGLKLTAAGNPIYTDDFEASTATFKIENHGTDDFKNIEIAFEIDSNAVLNGGDEFSTTKGIVEDFITQKPVWKIEKLAPGESARLNLNLYVFSNNSIPVFGQVIKATGQDQNSTPGNAICCQPNEDDEAIVHFNSEPLDGELIDLELGFNYVAGYLGPPLWSVFSKYLVIQNNSDVTATGIRIKVEKPEGTEYEGDNEYSLTAGDFDPQTDQIWRLDSLSPMASDTLFLNFYRTALGFKKGTAEVIGADQRDMDSAIGGRAYRSNFEDDETGFWIRDPTNAPLKPTNFGEKTTQLTTLSISPNPISDQFELKIVLNEIALSSGNSKLRIFDLFGKLLFEKSLNLSLGYNSFSFDASDLPNGMLVLKLEGMEAVNFLKM